MLITCSFFDSDKYDGAKFSIARSQPVGAAKFPEIRYLAPSRVLLDTWKNDKISWKNYVDLYRIQLRDLDPIRKQYLRDLIGTIISGKNIILMCWERTAHQCHRRLFAEWLIEQNLVQENLIEIN